MALKEGVSNQPVEFTGGFFVGITASGDCIVKGVGELDKEHVTKVTSKLVLLVSRLRQASMVEHHSSQLH